MKVIHSFTSKTRYSTIPIIDTLVWAANLVQYKKFGYQTKLYCSQHDIEFLKKNKLYDLYDEIDAQLFNNIKLFDNIDPKRFWAVRKFVAIDNEIKLSGNQFFYSDVDIVMRKLIDFSGDCVFWSPEERMEVSSVYVDWSWLSKPKGYKMPKYIANCSNAYNCGIMWFNNPNHFYEYFEEFKKFAINNPCEVYEESARRNLNLLNNLFMCNAEQRILRAYCNHKSLDVKCVMPERLLGCSPQGDHYFYWRIWWRNLHNINYFSKIGEQVFGSLNDCVENALEILRVENYDLFKFFDDMEIFHNFSKRRQKAFLKIELKRYF